MADAENDQSVPLISIDESLARSRIGNDLIQAMRRRPEPEARFRTIVEFNANFPGGERIARSLLLKDTFRDVAAMEFRPVDTSLGLLEGRLRGDVPRIEVDWRDMFNSLLTPNYLFATLSRTAIDALARLAGKVASMKDYSPIVYRIWLDSPVEPQIFETTRTVEADAARQAYGCSGEGIVWAVADTGIDQAHPHFRTHGTLDLPFGIRHHDFTSGGLGRDAQSDALTDTAGHGTHVAGIIAGATARKGPARNRAKSLEVVRMTRTDMGEPPRIDRMDDLDEISGIAPRCKLLSLKVLTDETNGHVSRLIAALNYIKAINGSSGELKIHGVNLSLGYGFDIQTYAAGQSPLCREVNTLVESGVVVVASAGNGGYGTVNVLGQAAQPAALSGTITDPGNADRAITVGSAHRDRPRTYGVSYFSAKGPTADGRMKPDIVAPGERIVSCSIRPRSRPGAAMFEERNGTSMAAPHVSGAVAALLSIRRDYRKDPTGVKNLIKRSATSLGRTPDTQGAGLLDVMNMILEA